MFVWKDDYYFTFFQYVSFKPTEKPPNQIKTPSSDPTFTVNKFATISSNGVYLFLKSFVEKIEIGKKILFFVRPAAKQFQSKQTAIIYFYNNCSFERRGNFQTLALNWESEIDGYLADRVLNPKNA